MNEIQFVTSPFKLRNEILGRRTEGVGSYWGAYNNIKKAYCTVLADGDWGVFGSKVGLKVSTITEIWRNNPAMVFWSWNLRQGHPLNPTPGHSVN